jgi:tight adherence protein B
VSALEFSVFIWLTGFFLLSAVLVRRLMTPVGDAPIALRRLPQPMITPPSGSDSVSVRFDRWLHKTLQGSGIGLSIGAIVLISVLAAVLTAVGTFLAEFALAVQVVSALGVLFLLPAVLLLFKRRRIKEFSDQLPPTLDLIARAVRAGESFENAVEIASNAAKDPVQNELQQCVRQFQMGTPTAAVMSSFARRVPTMEVRIFAHTVSVHRELGGRLANGLERLAMVIRDRRDYVQKVNSMTSLGRFSIGAISLMGLFVFAYLTIFHPEYLTKLLSSELGLKMVAYALISEFVGLCWVAMTLRMEH